MLEKKLKMGAIYSENMLIIKIDTSLQLSH